MRDDDEEEEQTPDVIPMSTPVRKDETPMAAMTARDFDARMSEPKRICIQCGKEKATGNFHGTICEACHKANHREKQEKPVEKTAQFKSFKNKYYQTGDNLDFFGYGYQDKTKVLRQIITHMPVEIGEAILAESNRRNKTDNDVIGDRSNADVSPVADDGDNTEAMVSPVASDGDKPNDGLSPSNEDLDWTNL